MSLSSAEKKRLRDRRAQQTLRTKKQQYTTQLEDKVAHCERYHDDSGTQHLLQVIEGLQRENQVLRTRQEGLKTLITSWEDPSPPHLLHPQPPTQLPLPPIHSTTTTSSSPQPNKEDSDSISPLYSLLPLHSDFPSLNPSLIWLTLPPSTITSCPPSPHPLDLLYGTKTNPLANTIYISSLRRPLRDPERLAFGWLGYHYTKWLLNPNPETFAQLPTFMHPVEEQLRIAHPTSLDLIIWPEIRVTLIREWEVYARQRDDLFGFLACCMKVRWPWGESLLERDEGNELVMKTRFKEVIMCKEGWGITREFVGVWPDVVRGVDVGEVLMEIG
ncbi:hypothetical protein ASPBRDRAFT_69297 [Aspergillus brasiliensis CBS 101740]|uniref:BZIP domain-containing protein n=1 Tax=Aspergillus brasiliensis (strain CBS 101740 / IMI 381727 / IBT 21946) TaxID=767769 RepID=A0A1L9U6E7_ASPBC|nr:hypothetical protein ASPBRDRAFT_69297 [Aspergillus brasiliensis CBS 101740]